MQLFFGPYSNCIIRKSNIVVDSPPLHHYFLSILDHNMLESTDPWNSPIQIHCFYVQDANILVMLILILVFFYGEMSGWNAFDCVQKDFFFFFLWKHCCRKNSKFVMLCSGCLPSFYQVAVFSLESSVRLVAHLPFYWSYFLNFWIHEFMWVTFSLFKVWVKYFRHISMSVSILLNSGSTELAE